MKSYPLVPGVPAAGHVTGGGYWHPGRAEGCVKCPSPTPLLSLVPPRDPGGSAQYRRWTLVIKWGNGRADHVNLIGTTVDNPRGAQAEAAKHLGYAPRWHQLPTGAFRAEGRS
jgi:hypothetical protein